MLRLLAAAAIALTCLQVSKPVEAAVPAAPVFLTAPATGQVDSAFEVEPTRKGFVVAWNRGEGNKTSIFVQQFDRTGKALRPPVKLDEQDFIAGRPEIVSLNANAIAVIWERNNVLFGTTMSLITNKAKPSRELIKSDDWAHSAARLPNGDIAIVTPRIEVPALRYKNTLAIIRPTMSVKLENRSLHGDGYQLDGFAYQDQTVVATRTGGIGLWRDRSTGNVMGQVFKTSGGLAGKPFRVNKGTYPAGSLFDAMTMEVLAAKLGNGTIPVVWRSAEGDRGEIRLRLLSATGRPIGDDILVNVGNTEGTQFRPDVVALPRNRLAVLWISDVGIDRSFSYRVFDHRGKALTPVKSSHTEIVSSGNTGFYDTEAAVLSDGSIVNVLESTIFTPRIRAVGVANPLK